MCYHYTIREQNKQDTVCFSQPKVKFLVCCKYPKLVACTRIELVSVDYQSTALAIELTGCKFVLGRCSSADRLDIISRPLFGGKGEIRTHTGHRMKVLHNHYATLPYRNTLGYLPIYLGILFRKICFYMANSLRARFRNLHWAP